MVRFSESYLGRLRGVVGTRLLLVPGARVIVEADDGRILLQHRSDFDVWGIPGGNAEEGEGLETVAIRELHEEIGIIVSNLRPFGFSFDPKYETFTFPNGDKCQFFVLNFWTSSFTGVPHAADPETKAVDWFEVHDLPPMLPNMARSVEAYRGYKRDRNFRII